MLRINLEVTETPTRIKQIDEIAVVNQGWEVEDKTAYQVYHLGHPVGGYLYHHRGDGALVLAEKAIRLILDLQNALETGAYL